MQVRVAWAGYPDIDTIPADEAKKGSTKSIWSTALYQFPKMYRRRGGFKNDFTANTAWESKILQSVGALPTLQVQTAAAAGEMVDHVGG